MSGVPQGSDLGLVLIYYIQNLFIFILSVRREDKELIAKAVQEEFCILDFILQRIGYLAYTQLGCAFFVAQYITGAGKKKNKAE